MDSYPVDNPPIKHVLKALVLAPLLGVFPIFIIIGLIALFEPNNERAFLAGLMVYLYALGFAYAHIILAALPLYLGMRNKARITKMRAVKVGAFIGGIPTFLLLFGWQNYFSAPLLNPPSNLTLYSPCVIFAIFGALTGYVFWRIIRKDMPSNAAALPPQSEEG